MDPMVYLRTKDPMLRLTMLAICQRADDLDQKLGERRAIQIANAVAKAFSAH